MTEGPAIVIDAVYYTYDDGTDALRGVSATIQPGECVGFVGENGSGKTTLCKHLNGLLRPKSGKVIVRDRDTALERASQLSRQVGYLFQNPDHQIFRSTVFDEVAFGIRNLGLDEAEVKRRVERYLELLGLSEYGQTAPMILSMGLRRLVSIASLLSMEQEILVLDEPTAWLDFEQVERVLRLLKELKAGNKTLIIVTHDLIRLAELAERMLIFSDGKIVRDGSTSELLADFEGLESFHLKPPPVVRLGRRVFGMRGYQGILTNGDFIEKLRSNIEGGARHRPD